MRMFARVASVLVLGLLAPFTLMAGVAHAGASTTITIKQNNGDFSGTIDSSDRSNCANHRTIYLWRVRSGADDRLGSDTSERDGRHFVWSTGNTHYTSGHYYAKAGRIGGCEPGKSKTIGV